MAFEPLARPMHRSLPDLIILTREFERYITNGLLRTCPPVFLVYIEVGQRFFLPWFQIFLREKEESLGWADPLASNGFAEDM